MKLIQFKDGLEETWENFCKNSLQDTFLVERRFLKYHKNRFSDKSLLIYDKEKLVAIFPAAECNQTSNTIVSHPGITFGGLLHDGQIRGSDFENIYHEIGNHFSRDYQKLIVKPIPIIYQTKPNDDESFGLFRVGAKKTKFNLGSAIDLTREFKISSRRRRGLNKSLKSEIAIGFGVEHLKDYWEILEKNLQEKFGTSPTHSFKEILELFKKFPNNIKLTVALSGQKVICGVVTFSGKNIEHAQYIASNTESNKIGGLDFVFQNLIESTSRHGKRWFDFGTSNLDHNSQLNDGLYRFKSEFGGGGIAYEEYTLEL